MTPYDAGAQLYCNDMNSTVHLGYNDLSFPLGQIVINKLSVQQKESLEMLQAVHTLVLLKISLK